MIADREGRFENRPKRIKALVMPLWSEVDFNELENLVEKLSERGLLRLYKVGGKQYGEVVNWQKHQHPDPREAESVIPPALPVKPVAPTVTGDSVITLTKTM
jgi:hypothetical protein